MKIISQDVIRQYLRARCDLEGQAKIAKDLEVSQPYVSALYNGSRDISKKVAEKLGYTLIRNFTKE